jgi:hypothetical protein
MVVIAASSPLAFFKPSRYGGAMIKPLVFLCLFTGCPLFAFDPAGPPPERSMEWTTRSLADVRIPYIDFKDVAMIDALVFATRIDVPKAYRVWLEYPNAMEQSNVRLTLEAKNISWMELLGIIAAKADMDLRIQPGLVTFVPRSGQPVQNPAPPANAAPSVPSDPPQREETNPNTPSK